MKERLINLCCIVEAFTMPLMLGGLFLLIFLASAPAVTFN